MRTDIILSSFTLEEFKNTITEVVTAEIGKVNSTKVEKETEYLTRKETAEKLRVSYPTLNTWAKEGILKPNKIGSKVLYSIADIEQTLNSERIIKTRNRQK